MFVIVCLMYVFYVAIVNLVLNPDAGEFLAHKVNQLKQPNRSVWLTVLHIHVWFSCLAMLSGAINFSSFMYNKHRKYHKRNGYAFVFFVAGVSLTAGYMAPYSTGGKLSSIGFNLTSIIWLTITVLAIVHVRSKRMDQHRGFMIRSYAFCFTNLFVHFITKLLNDGFGMQYETSYTAGVYGAIIANLLVAEVVIRYGKRGSAH